MIQERMQSISTYKKL